MVEKRKVVLVGTGFVGMSMAYSLLNQGCRFHRGGCTTKTGRPGA